MLSQLSLILLLSLMLVSLHIQMIGVTGAGLSDTSTSPSITVKAETTAEQISSSLSSSSSTTTTTRYIESSQASASIEVDSLGFSTNVPIVDKSTSLEGRIRKLMGSTCITMERGVVTKYYECIGCPIELAQACIDDMRLNKSSNVATNCHIDHQYVMKYESEACCPTFQNEVVKKRKSYSRSGNLNLNYVGSQYPEAIRCLETVGCTQSVVYSQLVQECQAVCPFEDPRTAGSVCFSQFNSSNRLRQASLPSLIAIALCIVASIFVL